MTRDERKFGITQGRLICLHDVGREDNGIPETKSRLNWFKNLKNTIFEIWYNNLDLDDFF